MWQSVVLDKSVDGCKDILMPRNIIQGIRPVLLNPEALSVTDWAKLSRSAVPWETVAELDWQISHDPFLLACISSCTELYL